jgi:hypothetical protein
MALEQEVREEKRRGVRPVNVIDREQQGPLVRHLLDDLCKGGNPGIAAGGRGFGTLVARGGGVEG